MNETLNKYYKTLLEIEKSPNLGGLQFLVGISYSILTWFLLPTIRHQYNTGSNDILILLGMLFILFPFLFGLNKVFMYLITNKYRIKQLQMYIDNPLINERNNNKIKKQQRIYSLLSAPFNVLIAVLYHNVLMLELNPIQTALLLFIPCILISLSVGIMIKERAAKRFSYSMLLIIEEIIAEKREND